ncbi:GNAT family N-acetyltransferase [Mucilaginibacter antarcticus]|uniref:GNAT family N-acetyltransferase n=1 Tax=Mucilaginibacter antarcticus TaxID=1855725 RepID=A0ABW5XLH7_9SPHI
MEIRPLEANNIKACAEIFIQTYNQAPWNYAWTPDDSVKYLKEYASSPQFKGFAIYEGSEIAGALLAHTKTWWNSTQLFIDELFVSPQFQKRGCGKQLMKYAEEYAEDNNLQTITLMTNKFMPAMNFYLDNDFIHAQPFVILFKNIQPEI